MENIKKLIALSIRHDEAVVNQTELMSLYKNMLERNSEVYSGLQISNYILKYNDLAGEWLDIPKPLLNEKISRNSFDVLEQKILVLSLVNYLELNQIKEGGNDE